MTFPNQFRWDIRGLEKVGGYVDAASDPSVSFFTEGFWPTTLDDHAGLILELLSINIQIWSYPTEVTAALLYGNDSYVNDTVKFSAYKTNGVVRWYKDVKAGMIFSADLFKMTAEWHYANTDLVLRFFDPSSGDPITSGMTVTREIQTRIFDGYYTADRGML